MNAGDRSGARASFLAGIELARRYYAEVVRPLLDRHAPGLAHSAALIGAGSEVLGYDTARSADHNWGPRCQIFVGAADAVRIEAISSMLAARLPPSFLGWPTRFPDVSLAQAPVRHWVEVAELGGWLASRLGFDPLGGVGLADWLATPTQLLAELTAGAVFHDGLGNPPGNLATARQTLQWYPDDVWRYVLACQWQRISQEEAFPGRCAESGDELGSAIITARLARDGIRLGLLMHRRYPPYSKWLGTAAAKLPETAAIGRLYHEAIAATAWPAREHALCAAHERLAQAHNTLGLTQPLDASTRSFYDRPYHVIDAGRFAATLRTSIADVTIRELPLTGAVDQFIDSTDAVGDSILRQMAISARIRR